MSTKYTTIFQNKLPAYIKDDPSYSRFIDFFTAYYQWFDDTYDIYGLGSKLDIDYGFEEFYAYYYQDFLPYFPDIDTIAADKVKLIKIIKELYKSKGIPDSFKFLFKALYNTSVEIFETRQYVLKPSDGKWIVPKSIKIKSLDIDFLNIDNFKILGEVSKSVAVIEKSKISGKFIQIYLSNIQRVFKSGENITILDYYNKPVYFLNGKYVQYETTPPEGAKALASKVIGALSSASINANRRGKYYKVGDPIVITGGFDGTLQNPIGANGYISEVTTGKILNIVVTDGGYGYTTFPNTSIDVIKSDGSIDSVANCIVTLVDKSKPSQVSYVCDNCIEDNLNVTIGNTTLNFSKPANANTPLKDFISYTSFTTYPITGITVRNGGGGYEQEPDINFNTYFSANNVDGYAQHLEDIGVLAPIVITNAGIDYDINDTITISGGSGNFAYAIINSINSSGSILSVNYYQDTNNPYSVGGMGYTNDWLPNISVNSTTGANAVLTVPGILATGVKYTLDTDKIGAITKITLTENGEDYINTPNISLRIQDFAVSGSSFDTIVPGIMIIYQGIIDSPTFYGQIESTSGLYFDELTNNQVFSIRIYDFTGNIDSTKPFYIYDTNKKIDNSTLYLQVNYTTTKYKNGIKLYGDGSALGSVKFLDGLIEDGGRYLNNDGQLSAHSVLQDDTYNSSTYILSAEKDYDSYKTIVKNLLHPIGTHIITRNLLKSNSSFNVYANTKLNEGNRIVNLNSLIIQNSNSFFSNTIHIGLANISSVFSTNNKIYIVGDTNLNVYSTITSVNASSNTIQLQDYIQYKFPNVYNGYSNNSNTLVITKDNYTDTKYSLNSFVSIGDFVITANNATSGNCIINIIDNTLYFDNNVNKIGTETNTANVTIIKSLSSNNITIYNSV